MPLKADVTAKMLKVDIGSKKVYVGLKGGVPAIIDGMFPYKVKPGGHAINSCYHRGLYPAGPIAHSVAVFARRCGIVIATSQIRWPAVAAR